MKESETQNTALQCNTCIKGGSSRKSEWSLFATSKGAFLCFYLQEPKIENPCKCGIYGGLL
jgi:hypothetical protein